MKKKEPLKKDIAMIILRTFLNSGNANQDLSDVLYPSICDPISSAPFLHPITI
jgi:hypothetical protein